MIFWIKKIFGIITPELVFSNNIFENNDSETGKTFESVGFEGNINFQESYSESKILHRVEARISGQTEYLVLRTILRWTVHNGGCNGNAQCSRAVARFTASTLAR